MEKNTVKNIHFMGIGGSALSAVAIIARKQGYVVSGCDLESETPYIEKVKASEINIFKGHSLKHVDGADLVVISPAIEFQNNKHEEYLKAKTNGKLMVWDKFVGDFLLKNNKTISIAGTHGKSTTTALLALLYEKAGLDPSVIVGATVKEWKTNYRLGDSNLFVIEADEFYDKYLSYKTQYAVINNIEYDHPDYFSSEEEMLHSFEKFVETIQGEKKLVLNLDSAGVKKLVDRMPDVLNTLDVYGYTMRKKPLLMVKNRLFGEILRKDEGKTVFRATSNSLDIDEDFELTIPGDHNVYNALGVIVMGKLFGIGVETIKKVLKDFQGIGRRMDLIGNKGEVKVYDDYAHHPTAVRETLNALRQKHPKERIVAIIEAHSYSRTKALLDEYKGVFDKVDKVIVAPIFKARDVNDFGITGQSIVDISGHNEIVYIDSFEKIVKAVCGEVRSGDVVIVMGAGKSYQLASDILKSLK